MLLHLKQDWTLGSRIGDAGGFGEVFEASSDRAPKAAAKLTLKKPGAQREMLFVDGLDDVRNVVPIIDSGETETHWAFVMPRADRSLREHITRADGRVSVEDALKILIDLATTLVDLDGRVVHRDLKPENVLLLNGRWCVADFGAARYAEAATASDTRKGVLTPPYAGPERWTYERTDISTDVYSLGVVAYELLSGRLPFIGPSFEDYRDQHLNLDPPALKEVPARLASIVEDCLNKTAETRPSPASLLARLERAKAATQATGGVARLEEANYMEAARLGKLEREEQQARTDAQRREKLLATAKKSLSSISAALLQTIEDAAPSARIQRDIPGGWRAYLGEAFLGLADIRPVEPDPWGGWQAPAFTVVACAQIGIKCPPSEFNDYEGRTHSLWFCDAQEAGRYQWFETAFKFGAFSRKVARQEPFALNPDRDAAQGVWNGISEVGVAWPFTPLIVGELDDFIDRWSRWFADASQGRLRRGDASAPHPPAGSWRRE